MFKDKFLELFTEEVETIVGDRINIPPGLIELHEEAVPKTNVDIDSSAIMQAGYSRKKQQLYLRFVSNPSVLYIYHGLNRGLKDKFKFSPSKGQFFQKFIRSKFKTTKILGG